MKILIIGTGLTGLVAASQIVKQLPDHAEYQMELIGDGGGASPYVHGFNIPLHPQDDIDTFISDTMNGGYGLSRKPLVEVLCKESVKLLDDLEQMGIELEKKNGEYVLLKPLGSTWPRVTGSGNHTGAEIMSNLRFFLKQQKDVIFTKEARALRLDVREGRIRGVVLWNKKMQQMEYRQADAVLLACGGFCGIYPFSTNSADIGGDGIAMAYDAGLPLTDMEFVQFEPSVALYPEKVRGKGVITTMFYEGAVLRNGKLERFMKPEGAGEAAGQGECVGKDVLAKAIYHEMIHGAPTAHGGVWFDATGVGSEKLKESYSSYVERYAQVGINIAEEPFEIAPGAHTSLGGVVITPDCTTEVQGVFAAGEVTGGLHGANRVGGNAGLETLVFGKRAGKSICTYLKQKSGQLPEKRNTDETEQALLDWANQNFGLPIPPDRLSAYRSEMKQILQSSLYMERNGSDLLAACKRLNEMLKEICSASCQEQPLEKIRLENDLICASVLAHSAYARQESVGCHVRTDSPDHSGRHVQMEENHPSCLYHIVIRKGPKGMEIIKEGQEGQ